MSDRASTISASGRRLRASFWEPAPTILASPSTGRRNLSSLMYLNGFPVWFSLHPTRAGQARFVVGGIADGGRRRAQAGRRHRRPAALCESRLLREPCFDNQPPMGADMAGRPAFPGRSPVAGPSHNCDWDCVPGSRARARPAPSMRPTSRIVNPLPYAATTIVNWKGRRLLRQSSCRKVGTHYACRHAGKEIVYSFTADGAARAYEVDVKTRPADGFTPPFAAPSKSSN